MPPISAPVESCRYFPTTSLELARPFGWRGDFELSNNLADSQALAAKNNRSSKYLVFLHVFFIYIRNAGGQALPYLVNTSRAMALVTRSTFPVLRAGIIKCRGRGKIRIYFATAATLRAIKTTARDLYLLFVRIDKREGITGIPIFVAAFLINNSCSLGFGGGRKMPSGSLSNPSLVPNTPSNLSILS